MRANCLIRIDWGISLEGVPQGQHTCSHLSPSFTCPGTRRGRTPMVCVCLEDCPQGSGPVAVGCTNLQVAHVGPLAAAGPSALTWGPLPGLSRALDGSIGLCLIWMLGDYLHTSMEPDAWDRNRLPQELLRLPQG